MRPLNESELPESVGLNASPMPSTTAREATPAEHREIRRFEGENKGFAERMAAALNHAVITEAAKETNAR